MINLEAEILGAFVAICFCATIWTGARSGVDLWLNGLREAKPRNLSAEAGEIAADWFARSNVCLALALAALGIFMVSTHDELGWVQLVIAPIFGFSGLLSLSAGRRLTWSADDVRGPAKLGGLSVRRPRTAMSWKDIRKVGALTNWAWYLEDADGRRVWWSGSYKGYGAFVTALGRNRPDLSLPEDLFAPLTWIVRAPISARPGLR